MTQKEIIVRHCAHYGSISGLEAENYRIKRLAARIYDLKQDGFVFTKERRKDLTGRVYDRYIME